ncbi:hypothetical protein N0V82_003928 [Gnomoniopsis sp. IMI 355080]|nr:hypothetical protein N0V82_003928 [Gnomoniopsis sp. IMI 355080]
MSTIEGSTLETLKEFTTCDISQALVHLGYRNGGFLSGLTMWSPERQAGATKLIGPAYTVKYAPKDDPAPKLQSHYIDSVPEGAVVFVSCPPGIPNGLWSSLVAARGQARGAAGAIIDGRIRDLGEHRERLPNFPIFGRDTGTAPPHELVKVIAVDVPVQLASEHQDMTIQPGDYLIGDLNGVVVLPKEAIGDVVAVAKKQVEADARMMEEINKGMSLAEASKKFRG